MSDARESEERDGARGDEDEMIVSGGKRRSKKTPKRQRPEPEDDEFTPAGHRGAYARSWDDYAANYVKDNLLKSACRDLEDAMREAEARLYS